MGNIVNNEDFSCLAVGLMLALIMAISEHYGSSVVVWLVLLFPCYGDQSVSGWTLNHHGTAVIVPFANSHAEPCRCLHRYSLVFVLSN